MMKLPIEYLTPPKTHPQAVATGSDVNVGSSVNQSMSER